MSAAASQGASNSSRNHHQNKRRRFSLYRSTNDSNEDKKDDDDEENDDCAICLDRMSREVAQLDSCRHRFCCRCASRWLRISRVCPLCKASVAAFTIQRRARRGRYCQNSHRDWFIQDQLVILDEALRAQQIRESTMQMPRDRSQDERLVLQWRRRVYDRGIEMVPFDMSGATSTIPLPSIESLSRRVVEEWIQREAVVLNVHFEVLLTIIRACGELGREATLRLLATLFGVEDNDVECNNGYTAESTSRQNRLPAQFLHELSCVAQTRLNRLIDIDRFARYRVRGQRYIVPSGYPLAS